MSELIIIKCPKCGKHFALTQEPVNPSVNVRCLACNEDTPYSQLRPVQESVMKEPAQKTIIQQQGHPLPVLKLISPSNDAFTLKAGRNIIGRFAPTSHADIMIDTGHLKHISREHAVVEVKEEMGKYVCYFSLYKKEINDTYVSDTKVSFGSSIRLKSGDRLQLPDNVILILVSE